MCLTEARKLALGVCTDTACWHLLSIFPGSYAGELPPRAVEPTTHFQQTPTFTPTLLKLAVHLEVTPTFAFREIFCRVASPQTRRVWQGNRARWPSPSLPGPSLPLSPASASPSVITFLVFFPVVRIASSCTVKNGNV